MYSANWKEAVKLHTGVSLFPFLAPRNHPWRRLLLPPENTTVKLISRGPFMVCGCGCTSGPPSPQFHSWLVDADALCSPPSVFMMCGHVVPPRPMPQLIHGPVNGNVFWDLHPQSSMRDVDTDSLWGLQHSYSPPGFDVLPSGRGRTEEGKAH